MSLASERTSTSAPRCRCSAAAVHQSARPLTTLTPLSQPEPLSGLACETVRVVRVERDIRKKGASPPSALPIRWHATSLLFCLCCSALTALTFSHSFKINDLRRENPVRMTSAKSHRNEIPAEAGQIWAPAAVRTPLYPLHHPHASALRVAFLFTAGLFGSRVRSSPATWAGSRGSLTRSRYDDARSFAASAVVAAPRLRPSPRATARRQRHAS